MKGTILVLGATGAVGRRVVSGLRARGHLARCASRRAMFDPGWTPFDLLRPETYRTALTGVSRVMLMSRPGDEHAHKVAQPFIEEMVRSGVRHVAVLSALGAERRPDFSLRRLELLVEGSGLSWTHIRPNVFMQMLAAPPLSTEICDHGTLSLPMGNAKVGYVHASDVAAVIVCALTDDALAGHAVDVNGPEALNHSEVAQAITDARGRSVLYRDLPAAEAQTLLQRRGFSAEQVARLMKFYELGRAGWCDRVDSRCAAMLGRPLVSFRQFAFQAAPAWRHELDATRQVG